MPRARRSASRPRSARPSAPSARSPASQSPDEAIRSAFRDALKSSFAGLAADLERIAARFSGARRSAPSQLELSIGETPASEEAPAASAEAAPEPRACAVIGCRRPERSLGYCASHYQKRRLMVATGRLHRAWVTDAAPQSIPDVILPRKRREVAEKEAPPADTARPATPRAWVRRKGQSVSLDSNAEASSPTVLPEPRRNQVTPRQPEGSTVTDTVARWAAEFRAGKRGH